MEYSATKNCIDGVGQNIPNDVIKWARIECPSRQLKKGLCDESWKYSEMYTSEITEDKVISDLVLKYYLESQVSSLSLAQ